MHKPLLLPFFIFSTLLIVGFAIAVVSSLIIQKQRQFRNKLMQQQLEFNYGQSMLHTRIEVQETTLNMLAQELHDNVIQMLTGCFIQIASAGECDDIKVYKASIEEAKGNLKNVIGDVRQLSHSLATGLIENRDIQDAIQAELTRIQKFNHINCTLNSYSIHEPQPDQRLILFRIVQESLQNILKHAAAQNVTITIRETGQAYHLMIEDDGKGFDTEHIRAKPTLGLINIRERIKMLKGTVAIDSVIGKGTIINISIPIKPSDEEDKNSLS